MIHLLVHTFLIIFSAFAISFNLSAIIKEGMMPFVLLFCGLISLFLLIFPA